MYVTSNGTSRDHAYSPSASNIVILKGITNSLEFATVAVTGTRSGGSKAMLSIRTFSPNCTLEFLLLFVTPLAKALMYR